VGPEKKGVSKRMNQNAELDRRVGCQERCDVKPHKYTVSATSFVWTAPQFTCPYLGIPNDIGSSDLQSAAALRNKRSTIAGASLIEPNLESCGS
jgi:hypothetical protein